MLSFDDFRKMARDPSLAPYEKVGFQAVHRGETEAAVFPDILAKLDLLQQSDKTVMDIGCGCSLPALQLIEHCGAQGHHLVLVDSEEMLDNLPDAPHVEKSGHEFPRDEAFLRRWKQQVDVIICYSVLHVLYPFQNLFTFVDRAVSLLRPGGQMLVGDVANISKKKRFLSSSAGKAFHRQWSGEDKDPEVSWMEEYEQVDDSVLFHLMLRYRSMGMETYLLPQRGGLPMNNTREDLLICKW